MHFLDRNHANGSLCLNTQLSGVAKGKTGAGLRELCEEWIREGRPGGDRHRWMINLEEALGLQFDFYGADTCGALQEAAEASCAFDARKVQDWTAASNSNGGDFTIAFWYKPSDRALGDSFTPSIKFFSSLFPPEVSLELGDYSSNPGGELRLHTSCSDSTSGSSFEMIRTGKTALDGSWTFFSFVRRNVSVSAGNVSLGRMNTVLRNMGVDRRASDTVFCLHNPSALFNAIVVNKATYLSAISLYPVALSPHQLQDLYYESGVAVSARRGPVLPLRQEIPVEVRQYEHRSALVAPPMLFQVRSNTSTCAFSYSNEWVGAQMRAAERDLCAGDFDCGEEALEPIACSGDPSDSSYFGLNRVRFGEREGYAEFLATLAEYDALWRDGELQSSARFVDRHTSELSAHLVFFSPTTGILTYLVMSVDLSRPEGVKTVYNMFTFNILDGTSLVSYTLFESVVTVVLIFVLGPMTARKIYLKYRRKSGVDSVTDHVALVGDLLQVVFVPITIAVRLSEKINSNARVKYIVDSWQSIEWHDEAVPLVEKKTRFFDAILDLNASVETVNSAKVLVFCALVVSLMRVLQETSIHPRLSLLTGTLGYAAGHMAHALLVALIVMSSFAGIGLWRFGNSIAEFSTFSEAMAAELSLLFNPNLVEGWQDQFELTVFSIFLLFAMVLVVLNFLLAIIVESYMQVRKEIEVCLIELSFFEDLFECVHVILRGSWYRWPPAAQIAAHLAKNRVKNSVGFAELDRMGIFPSSESIKSFISYYHGYDFIHPEIVGKYGKRPKAGDDYIVWHLERRVALLLGRPPLTLRELAGVRADRPTGYEEPCRAKEERLSLQARQHSQKAVTRAVSQQRLRGGGGGEEVNQRSRPTYATPSVLVAPASSHWSDPAAAQASPQPDICARVAAQARPDAVPLLPGEPDISLYHRPSPS